MSVREELTESPATYGLAASWIVVYLIMLIGQPAVPNAAATTGMSLGLLRAETIHLWGAVTWRDFAGGEPWRAVTATFVHVNLPHLAMNLIGLIQLGRLMEPWYGGRLFLAICLGVGGIGNALGVLMRHGMASGRVWLQGKGLARVLPAFFAEGVPGITENTPAAGGSTVILGLIGLGLIVGWRSRTRIGAFLRDQMLGFLAFTAVLGFLGRQFIDNYGHTGGAIAGIACGFLHRRLLRAADNRLARRIAGVIAPGLIVACAAFQSIDARSEMAQAQRAVEARDAIVHAGEAEVLRERLVYLGVIVEQIANERFRIDLERAALLSDPSQTTMLDPSPAFELFMRGFVPVKPVEGTLKALVGLLRALVTELNGLRSRLEPRLASDDFDEVIRLSSEAVTGAIGSADLYRFRTARSALERLSAAVRDEWIARRDALERGESARRAAGEDEPLAMPRPAIPALDRRDKVGDGLDRTGKLRVIAADNLRLMAVTRPGPTHRRRCQEPFGHRASLGRDVVAHEFNPIKRGSPVVADDRVEILPPSVRMRRDDRPAMTADRLEQVGKLDPGRDVIEVG